MCADMSKWIYTELEFNIVQCSYPRYFRLHPIRLRYGHHWINTPLFAFSVHGAVGGYRRALHRGMGPPRGVFRDRSSSPGVRGFKHFFSCATPTSSRHRSGWAENGDKAHSISLPAGKCLID